MQGKGYREGNRVSAGIRLASAGSRWSFASVLVAAGFCWEAAHVWIAARYAASADPQQWHRAAEWEPDNAAYWAKLGSMEEWDFERGDLQQAEADYERAVEAEPHSGRSWLELAGIYERQDQTSRALFAYERARYNHPISSAVAWRFGNFLLRQGNTDEACGQFRKALLISPGLTEAAVAAWWKTGIYSSQPIAKLLPAETRYYFKAMDYFGQHEQIDLGLRVWDELLMLRKHFELPEALSFIDDAISAGRVGEARRVWRQALDVSRWPHDTETESSLIFNGGFEHEFAGGGFDWREQESADTSFLFDTEVAHSGRRSLRISFNGKSNLDFREVFQYVAVEPGRRYRFQAFIRSSAISTDSGIRFLLADPRQVGVVPVFTDAIAGTQQWTRLETEFVAGPQTRLLSVILRRTPSLRLDNKLSGIVWLDDVSLVALAGDEKNRQ